MSDCKAGFPGRRLSLKQEEVSSRQSFYDESADVKVPVPAKIFLMYSLAIIDNPIPVCYTGSAAQGDSL
jgi:hypothetical protein